MSMMNCESCGVAIDTDFNVEVIRDDGMVLCDKCWSEEPITSGNPAPNIWNYKLGNDFTKDWLMTKIENTIKGEMK